jgi:polar amino acid transport system substrate-binding protein
VKKILAAMLLSLLVSSCASMSTPAVPDAVRADLAPTGKLRGGMNLSNALFTGRDKSGGPLFGVSVDLTNELARRLGVPSDFIVYETPAQVADDALNNKWDVAVLAIEPARAETVIFSPPMTEIEATYLVRNDSPLRHVSQVDAPGVKIAAAEKAGYELYLRRTLKHATLVNAKSTPATLEMFKAGAPPSDAVAGLKPALIEFMPKAPGTRLLEGNFMTVSHGLAIPKSKQASAAYVKAFIDEMVASGFIARSIERHGIKGLTPVKR